MKLSETIELSLDQLMKVAETNDNYDIDVGIAEVLINNKVYQVQVSLVADKKLWCKENEVRYSEVVKVHADN